MDEDDLVLIGECFYGTRTQRAIWNYLFERFVRSAESTRAWYFDALTFFENEVIGAVEKEVFGELIEPEKK